MYKQKGGPHVLPTLVTALPNYENKIASNNIDGYLRTCNLFFTYKENRKDIKRGVQERKGG